MESSDVGRSVGLLSPSLVSSGVIHTAEGVPGSPCLAADYSPVAGRDHSSFLHSAEGHLGCSRVLSPHPLLPLVCARRPGFQRGREVEAGRAPTRALASPWCAPPSSAGRTLPAPQPQPLPWKPPPLLLGLTPILPPAHLRLWRSRIFREPPLAKVSWGSRLLRTTWDCAVSGIISQTWDGDGWAWKSLWFPCPGPSPPAPAQPLHRKFLPWQPRGAAAAPAPGRLPQQRAWRSGPRRTPQAGAGPPGQAHPGAGTPKRSGTQAGLPRIPPAAAG